MTPGRARDAAAVGRQGAAYRILIGPDRAVGCLGLLDPPDPPATRAITMTATPRTTTPTATATSRRRRIVSGETGGAVSFGPYGLSWRPLGSVTACAKPAWSASSARSSSAAA